VWKDVTLHFWIWISTFKGTDNRLPKHCNRLQLFENNWNVVNSIWKLYQNNFATGNRLQQFGNRLLESKNSLVKGFVKKSCAIQSFEKLFNTYLDWVFSSFLNLDLDSWDFEPWILILDFLLESWIFLDSLELFFDWSLSFLSSPLSSSFVIIIVIIKTSLNHSWFTMKLCLLLQQQSFPKVPTIFTWLWTVQHICMGTCRAS